ncbi:6-phosphogluconolactonase [Pseudoalteromonas luteoviolacea B = ATCC 29581]|nr:6-phosphogluconolactonase [Pseudoalteromonas luteoviolacea B = ATCC 29581]
MANITERFFESKEEMTQALATLLEVELSDAVSKSGEAVLMVSGGSSPKAAYEYLSTVDLGWSNITVAMVDERWVEASHEKSNEAFIKSTLLKNNGAKARFLAMKNDASTAKEGHKQCEQRFNALRRPFDVTILGMGPDGHTASLFPHAEGLDEALSSSSITAPINAIESEVTGSITERMSLSLAGIAATKHAVLLISGEEKRAVYQRAKETGEVADMPLRAVLQHPQLNLTVFWAP